MHFQVLETVARLPYFSYITAGCSVSTSISTQKNYYVNDACDKRFSNHMNGAPFTLEGLMIQVVSLSWTSKRLSFLLVNAVDAHPCTGN